MLLGPPPVVTIMSTSPITWADVTQVIVVALTTLKDLAFNQPNVTELAFVKLVPVIVTEVPPSVLPDDFEIPVMLGGVI